VETLGGQLAREEGPDVHPSARRIQNMHLTKKFLECLAMAEDRSSNPLVIPWPMPGNLGAILSFSAFAEWQAFVCDLSLRRIVPDPVAAKFERSQKLHLLAWIDFDFIKAGELIAMTALELALKDRYGDKVKRRNGSIPFAALLHHMVAHGGLTDDKVPLIQRCGQGSVVDRLTGEPNRRRLRRMSILPTPSLADIRNSMAHGDPFDSLPWAGLLELVRDLIDYSYRD
jgi:hypothetical protein